MVERKDNTLLYSATRATCEFRRVTIDPSFSCLRSPTTSSSAIVGTEFCIGTRTESDKQGRWFPASGARLPFIHHGKLPPPRSHPMTGYCVLCCPLGPLSRTIAQRLPETEVASGQGGHQAVAPQLLGVDVYDCGLPDAGGCRRGTDIEQAHTQACPPPSCRRRIAPFGTT